MKPAMIILAILATVVPLSTARDSDYCYAYDNDPYILMGTKTAYEFVYGRQRMSAVPNCTPVQIWMLARHGTRYPGEEFIKNVHKLVRLQNQIITENEANSRLCSADLENLRNWRPNQDLNEAMVNRLTPQGAQDMNLLGRRLTSAFPELLRPKPENVNSDKFKFRSTKAERAVSSLEAFMDGVFHNKHAVPVEIIPDNDTLLRAYKNCSVWEKSLIDDHVYDEADNFIAGHDYQNFVLKVSRRLGFRYKIDNDSIQLMYDMCRYDKAWDVTRPSPWCAVFSKDEMKILEYLEDLDYYYYSGPGREINAKLSCSLQKNLFNHFKNLEAGNFTNEPLGVFYFTHTITIQSLLDSLGIGKDETPLLASNFRSMDKRNYRTSNMNPFAANLVVVFYRCSEPNSPNRVMFYLNESPVMLKGCSVGLCDLDYLKERFGKTAEECSLDFCHGAANVGLANPALVCLLVAGLALARSIFFSS